METITVTLPDDLARWVEVRAAENKELHDRAALRRHPVEDDAGDG